MVSLEVETEATFLLRVLTTRIVVEQKNTDRFDLIHTHSVDEQTCYLCKMEKRICYL